VQMRTMVLVPLVLACAACSTRVLERDSCSWVAPRSGMVDIGGTEMYYDLSGTGPPVLFLHAGIAHSRMWDLQAQELSTSHQIIRCDLRGFGRTAGGDVRFSFHQDVATLMDSLGIPRVHLVGCSLGGRVAIDFALAYPERVLSLVLCSPAVSGMPPTPELAAIDSMEGAFLRKNDPGRAADAEIRAWVVGPSREPEEVSSSLREKVKAMLLQNYSLPAPEGGKSVPLEPRAMTRLEQIQAPTLIIMGDKDVPSFQDLSAEAAQRIPCARRVVVAGAAHLVNMEKPEEFNRILIDFLTRR